MFHCDECELTVHENDRETHIHGGKHQNRIRQKNNEPRNVESLFECGICDSKFTNIGFYTIHMGSKTHKRNLRRRKKPNKKVDNNAVGGSGMPDFVIKPIARRVPIEGIDKYITVDDLKERCDYNSTREKYRPRNDRMQEGHNKTFTSSVAAYWAITLALDPTVRDFKMSINEKDWADFGDAIIEIQFKETSDHPSITTTFAVQFKHISNNVNGIDSFSEGQFSCTKYISQIAKIKGQNDIENKKYVVFTTATVEPGLARSFTIKMDILHKGMKEHTCNRNEKDVPVVAKTLSNRRKLLVDTSGDNENIYFFYSTDETHLLPKLYFYCHQKKLKGFSRSIDDTVNDKLEDTRVTIYRDFIKYIEYWSDGFLGGNYRLKREDVLVKLGHLLLFEFKVPPHVRVTENQNYGIWNQAVNSVDVTVLIKHPVIISKICTPINIKIERELDLKIDTTTSTLKVTQDNINNIKNSVLKMYLFEETMGDIHDDVSLDIVYDIFWKAGLIPMILEVKEVKHQYHVLQVITLLKSLGLTRRYFLNTSDKNIKTILKYYKTLTFFVSVDDIARRLPSFLLDNIKISVSDVFSMTLKSIQDSDLFFQKRISANEFFDMSLSQYSFKSTSNQLARREHGAEDLKLLLDDPMMIKLKEEIDSKNYLNNDTRQKNSNGERWLRGINPDILY